MSIQKVTYPYKPEKHLSTKYLRAYYPMMEEHTSVLHANIVIKRFNAVSGYHKQAWYSFLSQRI